ncbi:LexA family transcriptional regulator [Immundisolibacter sp.]|jgi:repressor LexA|uniref:LexA family protein n=1 Tax=Immundisolibacter sp. TaxID=1934948 RepID=UPI002B13E0F8|nr:LexA family transcriptional regulator [Immundisolibacter sp.]MEA3219444.1 LexA repressor [Immundisolibacter sp.]
MTTAPAPLPPRQAAALQAIERHFERHGATPTVRELAQGLGCSVRAAAELIEKLVQRGALHKVAGVSRGLRLAAAPAGLRLPLIGRIAAGQPIMAADHVEDWLAVDPALFRPRPDWLFRVQGWSMKNIGVLPDDLVGVREDPDPPPGAVVAALVPDPQTGDPRLTLKRYARRAGQVVLVSEHDDQVAFAPQVYDPATPGLRLIGVYAGLIRPATGPWT